ncbi:MAG: TauD/TfdA family dioxygenase, partial [Thioalkalispiraceae bacterium]
MNLNQLIDTPSSSPFNLANDDAYQQWRRWKLANAPASIEDLMVEVEDANALSPEEIMAITRCCQACNMAIYIIKYNPAADKATIKNLGAQLGLVRLDSNICADEDSITSLTYRPDGRQKGYIPYSNMRLSWHTDGYYNTVENQIRSIVMFCVQPAAEGGENALLDHEMLYIHLRDRNPAYISALMQANAMTIPANVEAGEEIRAAQTGPVFSIHPQHGTLHMRYSARTRNIIWNDDTITREAVACISEFLDSADSPVLHYKLNAGEGIICNNVLHNRTGFSDDAQHKRLLYRARYYDRIARTELDQINSQIQ